MPHCIPQLPTSRSSSLPVRWPSRLGLLGLVVLFALGGWPQISPAQRNCRLDKASLGPVIDAQNPFFYGNYFDERTKTEIARLSPERRVKITQEACQHHRVKITLTVDESETEARDLNFYTIELFNLMNRLHWNDPDYDSYRTDFEREFIKAYRRNGLTQLFNFPLADRTFICLLDHVQGKAHISIEIVKYVMEGEIVLPGIERYRDDGWVGKRNTNR